MRVAIRAWHGKGECWETRRDVGSAIRVLEHDAGEVVGDVELGIVLDARKVHELLQGNTKERNGG